MGADTMVIVYSATKGPGRDDAGHRATRAAGSTTTNASAPTGRSSRSRARSGSRFASSSRTRRDSSHSTRPVDRSARRRSRSPGGGARPPETGMGAGNAAGVSRAHARVLRERAAAPHRSTPSEHRTVLPGRDRDAARAGRLHQVARNRCRTRGWRPSRRPDRSRCCSDSRFVATLAFMNSPLEHQSRALVRIPARASRLTISALCARNLEVPSGGAVGTAQRDRARLQRLRHRRTRARAVAPRRSTCSRHRRFRRRAGSTTNA